MNGRTVFVLGALLVLVSQANAQATVNKTALGEYLDNMRKLESQKQPLDGLPASDVKPMVHEKSSSEQLAEDPDSIFVGRDVESLTHPTITSKVPTSAKGRGEIQGQPELCQYLLDASMGFDETVNVHGERLYNIAARLECNWTSCRLCQQRTQHIVEYCERHGTKDWLLRGVCEDDNEMAMSVKLRKMVFSNNPDSCRLWKDMQFLQVPCGSDDASICQGAHNLAEVCRAIGANKKGFMQRHTIDQIPAWMCRKIGNCQNDTPYLPSPGIEKMYVGFGNEKGAVGSGGLY